MLGLAQGFLDVDAGGVVAGVEDEAGMAGGVGEVAAGHFEVDPVAGVMVEAHFHGHGLEGMRGGFGQGLLGAGDIVGVEQ